MVSILILLDYLFLLITYKFQSYLVSRLNPYFIGLPILMKFGDFVEEHPSFRLNPYFIGLPILMLRRKSIMKQNQGLSQSLFYWITYSYNISKDHLIGAGVVSILILLDYLFL